MRIIINADDFGINEIVTRKIEEQVIKRNITSTTVMANGNCLQEALRFSKEHPEISYGVHLCLSEFSSITKSDILKKYGIIDNNGTFVNKAIFKIRNFDDNLMAAIRLELSGQIEKLMSMGFKISHADSHHHVHTIPELQKVFVEVLKHYGITKIRLAQDFTSWRSKRHLILWYKRMRLNKLYKESFKTTDFFMPYSDYRKNKSVDGCLELMCHPGHPGEKYKNEMDIVTKQYAKSEFNSIISYNEL